MLIVLESGTLDGLATYYAPGRMEEVAANRGLSWDGLAGGVALNDCRHLGRVAWVEHGGQVAAYRVVDCAQARHVAARERRGYVLEVDWPTARRWGMRGPVPARVYFQKPEGAECELSTALYRCY